MVSPVSDLRGCNNYDFLISNISRHIQTQCVPDYLWRWSGRSDHNLITMCLLIIHNCLNIWAPSECGQYQDKGRMLEPVINGAPVSLTLPLSLSLPLSLCIWDQLLQTMKYRGGQRRSASSPRLWIMTPPLVRAKGASTDLGSDLFRFQRQNTSGC